MQASRLPRATCCTTDPQSKLWPVQRRCVLRRAIAPEMVQLERSCLADLSTDELEQQLKKHGGSCSAFMLCFNQACTARNWHASKLLLRRLGG